MTHTNQNNLKNLKNLKPGQKPKAINANPHQASKKKGFEARNKGNR